MAWIDQFIIGRDLMNLEELRHDVLGKILEEHRGHDNAITHSELCHYYYDPYPIRLEDEYLISNMLQDARGILQAGGWFLDYRRGVGWYAAVTSEEAYDHILRYAKREIRLHRRLQTKAQIGVDDRYRLPAHDPLMIAIHGTTPAIDMLEEAIEEVEQPTLPQLEEGNSNENED